MLVGSVFNSALIYTIMIYTKKTDKTAVSIAHLAFYVTCYLANLFLSRDEILETNFHF